MQSHMFCFRICLVVLTVGASLSANAAMYLGPSPYLAFDDPSADTAVSPFKDIEFDYFHLEDFEDGVFNSPGATVREFTTTNISFATSDSVDGDDGVIDGFATGNARSLFSNFSASSFTFDFSAATLGRLPTHAGIVWTDIGMNFGGNPLPTQLVNNTTFEAFGPNGESLGVVGPYSLGDSSISRTTAEDRFFGVVNTAGISSIKLSMPGMNNWEVDHLQYGGQTIPEPSCLSLSVLMMLTLTLWRERRTSY